MKVICPYAYRQFDERGNSHELCSHRKCIRMPSMECGLNKYIKTERKPLYRAKNHYFKGVNKHGKV
jgi:hypothetical protein